MLGGGLPGNLAWGTEGRGGPCPVRAPGPSGSTGFSRPMSILRGDAVPLIDAHSSGVFPAHRAPTSSLPLPPRPPPGSSLPPHPPQQGRPAPAQPQPPGALRL